MRKIMAEKGTRAVALGLFDGVHLGHREVIKAPAALAECGFIPAVFTFRSSTVPEKQGRRLEYIYTDAQKELLVKALGISEVFSWNFSEMKNLSGEEFVRNILVDRLNTRYAVCGRDFRFGKRASCGIAELFEFGRQYGFGVEIADDVKSEGENVSSKKIREQLKNGEIQAANALLGSPYRIDGEVVHGQQLGRTLNFPTINQLYGENQLVPRKGVYQSVTLIGGTGYSSVTNIGVKPTVAEGVRPLAETHILGYDGDLYGKNITVTLRKFLRDERKFSSVEELGRQIRADIDHVKEELPPPGRQERND